MSAPETEIARLDRELSELDEWEEKWSAAARKARKLQLEQQLRDAVAREEGEKDEARRAFEELSGRLESAYAPVIEQIRSLNEAVEELQELRGEARAALDRARRAAVPGAALLPPKLSARAVNDRSVLAELHRLRSWAGGDW